MKWLVMMWLVACWVVVSACGTILELQDDEPRRAWLAEQTDVRVTVHPLTQEEQEAMFGSWWPDTVRSRRWRITVETRALPAGAVVTFGWVQHLVGTSKHDYSVPEGSLFAEDHAPYDGGEEPKRQDYEAITVSPRRPSAGQNGGGWQILGALTFGLVGPRDPDPGLTKKEAAELQEELRAQAREYDDKRIAEWRVAQARYESYRRTIAMLESVEGCDVDGIGHAVLEVGKTCAWISEEDRGSSSNRYADTHELALSICLDGLAKDTEFLFAKVPLDERDVDEQLRELGPIQFGRAR